MKKLELKVSIFDALSYFLPGFIYFLSFALIGDLIEGNNAIVKIMLNPSTSQATAILLFSYILGHALQPLYRLSPFVCLIKKIKENQADAILEHAKTYLKNIGVDDQCSTRAILGKILLLHDEKLSSSPSRFLALSIFMRNLSFPLLLLAIAILPRYRSIGVISTDLIFFMLMLMSILVAIRSYRYKKYSNLSAIEGIISVHLKNQDILNLNKHSKILLS